MSRNALLEAGKGTDGRTEGGYHSGMNRNGPLQAPAPPQWQPAYPPVAPPPRGGRRWIPAAIISAGIVIAGVVVGGAVIASNNSSNQKSSTAGTVVNGSSVTGSTPTCDAWITTRAALRAVPDLPAGWNWETPNIDIYINNQVNSVSTALNLFEPQIAEQPVDVASAAREYVTARRNAAQALSDRTYSGQELVPVNMALEKLNRVCGTPQ